MPHSPRRVKLLTGVELEYVEQGDPSGVPAVLLHGITDSWRSFEPVLPHLPPSIRALALTQRGHGDSSRPATGYGAADFAADVAAFADVLGLGRIVVVGHSMGAANAQRFALHHPGRVRGLVLVGSFASFRDNPAAVEFWESTVSTLTDPVPPALAREFQESTLARPVAPDFLDMVVQESLKLPARVWRAAFGALLDDGWMAQLAGVRAPTLLIWGDRDAFPRRSDQDRLLSRFVDSRLVVYEGAGHALHWEEPERFAADVAGFIARLGPRPAS